MFKAKFKRWKTTTWIAIEKYAHTINYNCLSLIAIGNIRLLNWYKSQGYVSETDKDIMDTNLKSYYMVKYIQ
jgi:hypothetical protein